MAPLVAAVTCGRGGGKGGQGRSVMRAGVHGSNHGTAGGRGDLKGRAREVADAITITFQVQQPRNRCGGHDLWEGVAEDMVGAGAGAGLGSGQQFNRG